VDAALAGGLSRLAGAVCGSNVLDSRVIVKQALDTIFFGGES